MPSGEPTQGCSQAQHSGDFVATPPTGSALARFRQNPAPPDLGAVTAGVVAGLDGDVVAFGLDSDVVAVGVLLVPGWLADPHAAVVTPSIATQAIGAMR